MSRYEYLTDEVRKLQPEHVVEIGTWSGHRAAIFMGVSNCYYTGFDLFEEASKETDEQEFNVKKHCEIAEVGGNLYVRGFSKFALYRGNTNKTLAEVDVPPFDFCFIDGGHSADTITNDFEWAFENISDGGVIILDDYYIPAIEGMGCNHITEKLGDKCELVGPTDRVRMGCRVSLVRVKK